MNPVSPFLERLARETRSERFNQVAAGMLTFELYRRVRDKGTYTDTDALQSRMISAKLRMDRSTSNGSAFPPPDESLSTVLAALEHWGRADFRGLAEHGVYKAWMEYAEAAVEDGGWSIAALVFHEIGADAEIDGFDGLSARARLREGFVAQGQSQMESAELLFGRARQLALQSGHHTIAYRAMLGQVGILRARGNIPAADALLTRVISRARQDAPEMLPLALVARGGVAHQRGDFAGAVRWAGKALQLSEDPLTRSKVLIDLASLLSDVPDRKLQDVSRTALEYVAVHAGQRAVRSHAALALLDLAVTTGRVDDFRQWRATLSGASLLPMQAVYCHLFTARGYRAFGPVAEIEEELAAAEAIAEQHGFGQLIFEIAKERAKRASASIVRDGAADLEVPAPWPSATRKIVRHINELVNSASEA